MAGPVAVGLVLWPVAEIKKIKRTLADYPAGKDSKKLTPKQRDRWFGKIEELERSGLLKKEVALVSNKVIDKKGINWAIRQGIKKNLRECLDFCEVASRRTRNDFSKILVLLDGGLKAPSKWVNQKTIIKGDEKELIIGLASIVAKVSRDRAMIKLSKKYPNHHLHQHKGYGTRLHYQKITEFGVLLIHRETYLEKF